MERLRWWSLAIVATACSPTPARPQPGAAAAPDARVAPEAPPRPDASPPDVAPLAPVAPHDAPVSPADARPGDLVIGSAADTATPDGWWDPTWPHRRSVVVDHPGSEDLDDFPLPIVLPADAGNVAFVDLQGRPLARQMEGDSIAWVRVPHIAAGSNAPAFWMYEGGATAPAAGEVFPAPYAGVWHFAGNARDATAHHQDAAKMQASFVDGPLGQALALDNASRQHLELASNSPLVSGASAVTVSLWVQHQGDVHDGQDIIIGIGTADTTGHLSRVSIAISPELGLIGEANPDEGAWDVTSSAPDTVPNDQWQYVTVVIDVPGHNIRLYRDGQPLGPPFRGHWTSTAYRQTPANRVTIGCEEDQSKSFFNGLIDELRVETTARSPGWIAAQARAASGKMATLGEEESLP
jgi:hypothetical protein